MIATRSSAIAPPGPVAAGLRIGLLGGSFNPAHDGHLHASLTALKMLQLDYVWWLVSPGNPLKPQTGMAPFAQRLAQARKIAVPHKRIIVTGVESALGTRYTVDTLAALQKRFPQIRFVWLMGSDNLVQFSRWRRWNKIMARMPVAVIARPGTVLRALASKPALCFARYRVLADKNLVRRKAPALAFIAGRHNALSATAIRAGSV